MPNTESCLGFCAHYLVYIDFYKILFKLWTNEKGAFGLREVLSLNYKTTGLRAQLSRLLKSLNKGGHVQGRDKQASEEIEQAAINRIADYMGVKPGEVTVTAGLREFLGCGPKLPVEADIKTCFLEFRETLRKLVFKEHSQSNYCNLKN